MEEERIIAIESKVDKILLELDYLKEEVRRIKERMGVQLFSKVAKAGDEVELYGKKWYVLEVDRENVWLIAKLLFKRVEKDSGEDIKTLCSRLHRTSMEIVENLRGDNRLLYTEVRSCMKNDIDKYLNRETKFGYVTRDRVWNVGYPYWLVPLDSSNPNDLWHVSEDGYISNFYSNRFYVRPVICLKPDIYASMDYKKDGWILDY